MSTSNLFKALGGHSWNPDSDAVGGPPGSLLVSNNLVADQSGAMASRMGCALLFSGLQHQLVHSMYTAEISGTKRRLMGIDSNLYLDGVNQAISFDGTGDFAMDDDSYQMFVARGTTKKKYDGTQIWNWGIAAPTQPPTLAATNAVFATVATFNSTETPAFTINEGVGSFVAGYDATANGALRLAPSATTGRASASKIFASDTDHMHISGSVGGDTDLFDMYVWLEDPRRVDTVTIMFGLNAGTDPYRDDYYSFTFKIREGATVDVKDEAANTAVAYATAAGKAATALTVREVTSVRSPADVSEVLKRLQRFSGPRAQARYDSAEASPAWTHFSVMRGQFKRVGGTKDRDWRTVRGFKVVYAAVPGSTVVAQFDSAVIQGGGARSLTGKFLVGYRFVRDTGNYFEKSPLSPLSSEIILTQQALQVTIPAEAINSRDVQSNQIWIYLFGGFLDTFYRFAVVSAAASTTTMALSEFDPSGDGAIDAADRTRLSAVELAIPGFTADSSIKVDVLKSEMDVLVENVALEPGATLPPDDIVAIVGPWVNRMFAITDDGYVYPSANDSPSNFSLYHVLDFRQWGTPLWAVRTNGGVLIGMTKDIVRIGGTGDETADKSSADMYPEPLGLGNPPVDAAYYTDGNSVVYRAADGLMSLAGVTATPVSTARVSLLWRGQTRHVFDPLNLTTGRFRLAVDNHVLYMLAPEGISTTSTAVVWSLSEGRWDRRVYPKALTSLHREPDGQLIAGATDGSVLTLETGVQDLGLGIPAELMTPIEDGGNPLTRKDPFDIQLLLDTGGSTATVDVFLDGSATSAASYSVSSAGLGTYRIDATGLGPFIRAQMRIRGTFPFGFRVNSVNLSVRERPQMMMAVDTGTILSEQGDMSWIQEVEIDCISPVNLSMTPYKDDVAQPTVTFVVTANKRSMYRKRLAKGLKARRPRLLFKTTNANGLNNVGFEPYSVRIRTRGTGNDGSEHDWKSVWPVGQKS